MFIWFATFFAHHFLIHVKNPVRSLGLFRFESLVPIVAAIDFQSQPDIEEIFPVRIQNDPEISDIIF